MSVVRFEGEGAGLGKTQNNGDASSPYNYTVTCKCGTFLGVLGGFRANAEGKRSLFCPKCLHATVVGETGQVEGYFPYDANLALKVKP